MMELIVINEELFKRVFYVYNIEWKEKFVSVLVCLLFLWLIVLKVFLIENFKMYKI